MVQGLRIKCTNNAHAVCGLYWEFLGVKSMVTVLLESKVKVKEVFEGKVKGKAEIGWSKFLTPEVTDCMAVTPPCIISLIQLHMCGRESNKRSGNMKILQ